MRLGIALAALVGATPALAQEPGDPATGRELAEAWCAQCHLVLPEDSGPGIMGAPAFADRARDPEVTSLYLRAFLRTPHSDMPDIRLSRTQTDDIVAYVLSLKAR